MVQILLCAEGSPALMLHSHTPSYRSGASKKTRPGNHFLIIVNGLLTIASGNGRGERNCHLDANNTAGIGLNAAKSPTHGAVDKLEPETVGHVS